MCKMSMKVLLLFDIYISSSSDDYHAIESLIKKYRIMSEELKLLSDRQ